MKTYYSLILFLATFLIHLYISTIGWNNPLLDLHGFRQAQTAISTYYFVKDGFHFDYETPVLGAPWSIPYELPLYQGITALIVNLTNLPLDPTGRLVSLVFFYVSLFIFIRILRELGFSWSKSLIFGAVILTSPIYLFWSRTFLPESIALAFSLSFFLSVIFFAKKKKWQYFLLALVLGSLAGSIKVTTFTIVIIPAIAAYIFINKPKTFVIQTLVKKITIASLLILLPLVTSLLWTGYTDYLKEQNPLARDFITSKALKYWNFGNKAQRLAPDTWWRMRDTTQRTIIGSGWLIVPLIVGLFLIKKYRGHMAVCLLAYAIGPLVFTNLYYVHEYYFYANAIFLLTAFGFIFVWLLEKPKLKILTQIVLLPAFILFLLFTHKKNYYPVQADASYPVVDLGEVIRSVVPENGVVLIYGYDWSAEIPYYIQRRALMDRGNLALTDIKMQESLAKTGKEKIVAMFTRYPNPILDLERTKYFGFANVPVFQNELGALYVKTQNPEQTQKELKTLEQKILYEQTQILIPDKATSPLPPQRKFVDGKWVLMVHAPGELVYTIPDDKTFLSVKYGIVPLAVDTQEKAGVTFEITAIDKNKQVHNLFTRSLKPKQNPTERSMQNITLALPKTCPCQLALKTLSIEPGTWDWSYWRDVKVD